MKRSLALAALAAALAATPAAAQKTTLNVVTAGDQNMVDYVKDFLAPQFERSNPNATVKAVGTGPGDAGSQKIAEKLQAQKSNAAWDVDVAVIHQKMAGDLVREGLLAPYVRDVATGRLVTSEASKNALGTNVAGYVIPMFQSQTAIAWNPALVKAPPKSYDELAAWAKANPRKFGYNGIKGGMSGVAFVVGWVYANTPDSERLMKGPYDPSTKARWDGALGKLKEFNRSVVITPGNAGTLDMLNRGEIAMGPVWVDMFYTWMADGKLPPSMAAAKKFVEMATSTEIQAEGIVKKFNWYPGIDAQHVKAKLDDKTWNKLFVDVTPQDLASKGKVFPIKQYFDDILESYERKVLN
jgi:ABC-type uncharacterized transport system YnjBCD substrate-binding protein